LNSSTLNVVAICVMRRSTIPRWPSASRLRNNANELPLDSFRGALIRKRNCHFSVTVTEIRGGGALEDLRSWAPVAVPQQIISLWPWHKMRQARHP